MVRRIAFAVPGDLAAPTGGYAYDRRMIAELEQIGWHVDIVNLGEGFPWPSDETRTSRRGAAISRAEWRYNCCRRTSVRRAAGCGFEPSRKSSANRARAPSAGVGVRPVSSTNSYTA